MKSHPYLHLIRYKQWADRGLYEVVVANIDRLDTQDATTLLRILDHIHVVDRIFQHHLQGLLHAFRAPRSEEMPEVLKLTEDARNVDAWYASYVGKLSIPDFDQPVGFVFTNGTGTR